MKAGGRSNYPKNRSICVCAAKKNDFFFFSPYFCFVVFVLYYYSKNKIWKWSTYCTVVDYSSISARGLMSSPHTDYGSTEGSGHLRSHAPDPVPLDGVGLCSEEQEQLIADQGPRKDRATSTEKRRNKDVIFNTANALLGASMFSMPWVLFFCVIGFEPLLNCLAGGLLSKPV